MKGTKTSDVKNTFEGKFMKQVSSKKGFPFVNEVFS